MRELNNLFRTGRVSSVDAKAHTVQVEFTEGDGLVTFDLPVLVTRPGDYALPPADALVLCAMQPGNSGIGYVLGCFYSESDAPPLDDAGKRSIPSDDLRLGDPAATKKIALADASKTQIESVLTYAQGIAAAIEAGVPVPNDGGASLKATMIAALPVAPTITAPAAENVSAK